MYVKKAIRAQATRTRLEHVARGLFAERGFAEVSAEELVARAGVTRGALYHHYNGKEGLFETVVESVMKDVHSKLAADAAGQPDPLRGLHRGIETFLKICTQPAVQRILLIDAPAILGWPKWREMDARYGLGLLRGALSGAMKAGLLRTQDADVLAHLLLGALIEAAMMIGRSKSPLKSRKAAEKALASMISGWRA
ncbi:MAG TPA: TetR/AcrR family transcriptional regulator [Candidatus Binataceae bacterium]|nr:TetR/AcrR family transcriptional regulator [Candidatus Binataceae bacterium]